MSEKGMTALCETAESESVQRREMRAMLHDQIAIAKHANYRTKRTDISARVSQ